MMSSPVTMRSTLRARGVHAASVSFMVVPPNLSHAQVVSRCGFQGKRNAFKNCARLRKAAWNNASGKVFAATFCPFSELFFARFGVRNGRAEAAHCLRLAGKADVGAHRRSAIA